VITNDEVAERFLIVATNLVDTQDYFEIKVSGKDDIRKVIEKFGMDFNTIADSLRIMNDVMVLLNPRMLTTLNTTIENS
jgi:hypothetical protein